MPWNPLTYNKFKDKRSEPFFDAARFINIKTHLNVIDLGCGTGELTAQLSTLLPDSRITGIDSSPDMLRNSAGFESHNLHFFVKSIEDQLNSNQKFDLVFSNAAIQWIDNHSELFAGIVNIIEPRGQLVIQIPSQHSNLTNKLLDELAMEQPFNRVMNNWTRKTPVLFIDEYAQLLFNLGGKNILVMEKIYPIIVENSDSLYEWVSGTAMIPYLEKLDDALKAEFILKYKRLLCLHFFSTPVFYSFKRIIMSAEF